MEVSDTGIFLLQKQQATFPNLNVSTENTEVPEVSFKVKSNDYGEYSVRISCTDATIREAPLNEFTIKGDPSLLLATNTQVIVAVLHCGGFQVHADPMIGGGAGTTTGGRDIGIRLVAIEAVAQKPSSRVP